MRFRIADLRLRIAKAASIAGLAALGVATAIATTAAVASGAPTLPPRYNVKGASSISHAKD